MTMREPGNPSALRTKTGFVKDIFTKKRNLPQQTGTAGVEV